MGNIFTFLGILDAPKLVAKAHLSAPFAMRLLLRNKRKRKRVLLIKQAIRRQGDGLFAPTVDATHARLTQIYAEFGVF